MSRYLASCLICGDRISSDSAIDIRWWLDAHSGKPGAHKIIITDEQIGIHHVLTLLTIE